MECCGTGSAQIRGGTYLWHLWLQGEDAVVLLTDQDIWLFRPSSLTVQWRIPLATLVRCEGQDSLLDLIVDPVRLPRSGRPAPPDSLRPDS